MTLGLRSSFKYVRSTLRKKSSFLLRSFLHWFLMARKRRRFLFDSLPKSCQYIASTFANELYLLNPEDKLISKSVFGRGEFDFHKFLKAFNLMKSMYPDLHKFLLIDVGANIGTISIPAVKRNYVKKSIAFELDNENFRLLSINCILNKVEHLIDCNNIALGDEERDAYAIKNDSNFGDHRIGFAKSNNCEQVIPMIKLDSMAGSIDLQSTILWIDVQGFEFHVLKGASLFLLACVPLIVEFSPDELNSYNSLEKLVALLSRSEYTTYFDLSLAKSVPTKLTSSNLFSLSSRLQKSNSFTDLLILR